MRQVPPSPIHHFSGSMAEAIFAALTEGAPHGPGTTLETTRRNLGSNDLPGFVAEAATELYARGVPSSRTVITADMVVAIVDAALDVLGTELNLNSVGWVLKDPDRSRGVIRRANNLYHEALQAQTRHALAAADSAVVNG